MKYKIIRGEECHNCGVADIPLAKFEVTNNFTREAVGGESYLLCEICASTHFSKALLFPRQCSDQTLYQSIAAGLSIILKEVRKGQK